MDWCMRNENFDVLPYLTTGESLSRHIEEYFVEQEQNIPAALKWGADRRQLFFPSGDN